ncbi:MAG: hypothetical protein RRZ93_03605, partial [Ruthenibacterium sp.]
KAVVVETKGTRAAALADDGCVVKVPNRNYVIGQVINMNPVTTAGTKKMMHIAGIAAAILISFGLGVGSYAYLSPDAYVSMDVNPSVEYTLNMFSRVLSVTAVNEDGAQLLQQINLKDFNNKTIDDAIRLTFAEIDKEGYFSAGEQGGIVIATSGKNQDRAEKLAETLDEIVKTQCKESKKDVKVETLVADQKMLEEAKALGVTPGKLRLVRELQEEYTGTEPFDVAAWLKKPVKDIMKETERLDAIEDAKEDLADAEEDALDEQADALEDAEDKAEEAAEKAADAKKKAAEKAEEAAEKAADAKEKAAEEAEEAAEKAEDAAEEAAERKEDAAKELARQAKAAGDRMPAAEPAQTPEADDAEDGD